MGVMSAGTIKKAANHLIGILLAEGRVPYTRFFDGTEETERKLAEAVGMSPNDFAWAGGVTLIDEAAGQMADQGYVKLTDLVDEKLYDGEQAYEIELLEQGRAMLTAGKQPIFRNRHL